MARRPFDANEGIQRAVAGVVCRSVWYLETASVVTDTSRQPCSSASTAQGRRKHTKYTVLGARAAPPRPPPPVPPPPPPGRLICLDPEATADPWVALRCIRTRLPLVTLLITSPPCSFPFPPLLSSLIPPSPPLLPSSAPLHSSFSIHPSTPALQPSRSTLRRINSLVFFSFTWCFSVGF